MIWVQGEHLPELSPLPRKQFCFLCLARMRNWVGGDLLPLGPGLLFFQLVLLDLQVDPNDLD